MPSPSQRTAVTAHRARLAARGMARFEVVAREQDRTLIRELARRLVEDETLAASLRAQLAGNEPPRGNLYATLRRSPLVGADINLTREPTELRPLDL